MYCLFLIGYSCLRRFFQACQDLLLSFVPHLLEANLSGLRLINCQFVRNSLSSLPQPHHAWVELINWQRLPENVIVFPASSIPFLDDAFNFSTRRGLLTKALSVFVVNWQAESFSHQGGAKSKLNTKKGRDKSQKVESHWQIKDWTLIKNL